jgi:NADH-ubiquinone oxidoreductase chain 5
MSGYYSKDLILESAMGQCQYYISSIRVYTIAVIGAIFTTLYSVKVLYLTFLTSPNGSEKFYLVSEYLGESKIVPPITRFSAV